MGFLYFILFYFHLVERIDCREALFVVVGVVVVVVVVAGHEFFFGIIAAEKWQRCKAKLFWPRREIDYLLMHKRRRECCKNQPTAIRIFNDGRVGYFPVYLIVVIFSFGILQTFQDK